MMSSLARSTKDIANGLANSGLALMLGWLDVKQRYRRSKIGPFWLSISTAIMIGTIGIVFSQIFKSPIQDYLPYLATGIIIWTYVNSSINEGCMAFIQAEAMIKQISLPHFSHIIRTIWRNLIILCHHIVILPIIYVALGTPVKISALLAIPGFIVLTLNLGWITLLLGTLSARFRDLPQIVTNLLQVLFYLTPIMWMPSLLPERAALYLLDLNPLYHLFEVVRAPLLGTFASSRNWAACALITAGGWAITLLVFGKFRHRIAFWV